MNSKGSLCISLICLWRREGGALFVKSREVSCVILVKVTYLWLAPCLAYTEWIESMNGNNRSHFFFHHNCKKSKRVWGHHVVTSFLIFWFGKKQRRAPHVFLFDISALWTSEVSRRRLWVVMWMTENWDQAPWAESRACHFVVEQPWASLFLSVRWVMVLARPQGAIKIKEVAIERNNWEAARVVYKISCSDQ